jgi:hypothetical protein
VQAIVYADGTFKVVRRPDVSVEVVVRSLRILANAIEDGAEYLVQVDDLTQ